MFDDTRATSFPLRSSCSMLADRLAGNKNFTFRPPPPPLYQSPLGSPSLPIFSLLAKLQIHPSNFARPLTSCHSPQTERCFISRALHPFFLMFFSAESLVRSSPNTRIGGVPLAELHINSLNRHRLPNSPIRKVTEDPSRSSAIDIQSVQSLHCGRVPPQTWKVDRPETPVLRLCDLLKAGTFGILRRIFSYSLGGTVL